MKIKSLFILLFLSAFTFIHAQITDYSIFDKKFNFYIANDLGRNGYYDQKPIAELMGTMGEEIGPEFVLATGDVHHFDGVRSVNDPLWMTNYELIYAHPELMIDWFPLLGNHEYRGSTQAVLDYTNISRRWSMPDRYYTKVFEEKGATIRIVWIDTTPLIDKYREESDKYPDACKQDISQQLSWLESVLANAKEDWIIVAGHHPIYAYTPKEESERLDMQKRVDSILCKHKVDMYICGHIHNFQHIRVPGSDIDYVVNSAASLARQVEPIEGTRFCSPEPGFSVCSIDKKDDPQERRTVMDLVKGACNERIYPVGRLDRNTTGVLLLTNDGDLASKLTHPKFLKKKIYHVHLDKNLTKADMDQIAAGVQLEDGEIHADAISYTDDFKKDQVGIEIHSGKNRIVRRIFESLGYKVVKLDRVFFAGLTKKGLRRGDWRYLSEAEVNYLRMGSFE